MQKQEKKNQEVPEKTYTNEPLENAAPEESVQEILDYIEEQGIYIREQLERDSKTHETRLSAFVGFIVELYVPFSHLVRNKTLSYLQEAGHMCFGLYVPFLHYVI